MSISASVSDNSRSPLRLLEKPLASGMSREVYALPGTNMLVKVQTKIPPRRYFQNIRLLYLVRRFYKAVVPLRRELREYERVAQEGPRTARHLQHFAGVVSTDRGTGILVKAVRRRNGALAMTLQDAIESGQYSQQTDAALSEFLDWLVKSEIVAVDVHLKNIVVDEKNGALVLIDGIGDKTFLPVRSWFSWLNRSYKKRLAQSIYAEVAHRFMRSTLSNRTVLLLFVFAGTILGIDISDGQLIDG